MNKLWSVLFGVIMLGAALLFVVAPLLGWWLPKDVSSFGSKIDYLFYLILGITGFFFVLTEALLVYFMWAYASQPQRPEHVFGHHYAERKVFWTSFFKRFFRPVTALIHNQHRLELAWTLVPGVILLFIALAQINAWAEIKYYKNMPAFTDTSHPLQIEVTGKQFEWRIRYPSSARMESWTRSPGAGGYEDPKLFSSQKHQDDIYMTNEVHVWKDQPVLVQLKTQDVIHSFYLPNLRLKQDALPGKTIPVWFMATESNTVPAGDHWEDGNGRDPQTGKPKDPSQVWDLVCAELCGWGHYKMHGRLYVHDNEGDFKAWLSHAQEEQNRRKPR